MKSFEYWLNLRENNSNSYKSYTDADEDTVYEIPVNGDKSEWFVMNLEDNPKEKQFILSCDPENWVKSKDGYMYLVKDLHSRINGVKESNESGSDLSVAKNKAYCQYMINTMGDHNPKVYGPENAYIKELQEFMDGTGRNNLKGRKDMRPVSVQINGDNFWLKTQYDTLNMWNKEDMKTFDFLTYEEWDQQYGGSIKESKDVTELKAGDKVEVKSSKERAKIISKIDSTHYMIKTKSGEERRVNLNAIEPIMPIGKANESNNDLKTTLNKMVLDELGINIGDKFNKNKSLDALQLVKYLNNMYGDRTRMKSPLYIVDNLIEFNDKFFESNIKESVLYDKGNESLTKSQFEKKIW